MEWIVHRQGLSEDNALMMKKRVQKGEDSRGVGVKLSVFPEILLQPFGWPLVSFGKASRSLT